MSQDTHTIILPSRTLADLDGVTNTLRAYLDADTQPRPPTDEHVARFREAIFNTELTRDDASICIRFDSKVGDGDPFELLRWAGELGFSGFVAESIAGQTDDRVRVHGIGDRFVSADAFFGAFPELMAIARSELDDEAPSDPFVGSRLDDVVSQWREQRVESERMALEVFDAIRAVRRGKRATPRDDGDKSYHLIEGADYALWLPARDLSDCIAVGENGIVIIEFVSDEELARLRTGASNARLEPLFPVESARIPWIDFVSVASSVDEGDGEGEIAIEATVNGKVVRFGSDIDPSEIRAAILDRVRTTLGDDAVGFTAVDSRVGPARSAALYLVVALGLGLLAFYATSSDHSGWLRMGSAICMATIALVFTGLGAMSMSSVLRPTHWLGVARKRENAPMRAR